MTTCVSANTSISSALPSASPRSARIKRIDEVMEITGSTYMKDRYVEGLSHGMKQRVGIARTLLHDPPVLVLDEPANGLDPQARIDMRLILLRLSEMGKTLIVTSHILPELSRICDHVAIMTHGKLRAFGTLEEIMRKVSQQRTIEIQLTSPEHIERAADLVRKLVEPGVQVEVSPTESIVRFATKKTEQELSALLARLIEANLGVSQFRELQADLEDTFLSITQATQPQPAEKLVAAGTSGGAHK
jgi:ABC-2 type transport system ATP-binding protein